MRNEELQKGDSHRVGKSTALVSMREISDKVNAYL